MTVETNPLKRNRWGLTVLSIIICSIIGPFLGFTFIVPNMFTIVPLLLVVLLAYVGSVSALSCSIIFMLGAGYLLSAWNEGICGIIGAVLFCLPLPVVCYVLSVQKRDFWISVGLTAACMFLASCMVIAIISMRAHTDAVTAIVRILENEISSDKYLGDFLISLFTQGGRALSEAGFNSLPEIADTEQRVQVFKQIMSIFDSLLRLQIPVQIATGSLAAGLLGQTIMRRGLQSQGVNTDCPPVYTWRIPKGWGRILGGTILVLFILVRLIPQYTKSMYYVFSGLFEQVFALQGISALCYVAYRHKKGRGLKILVFIVGYFLLQTPAFLFGIADQAMDITKRRKELNDRESHNPYDPRSNA